MNKLKQILATWRALNAVPLTRVSNWTEMDARNLGAFLGTETGRKLAASIENECSAYAQSAVFKAAQQDPRYACGVAAGMHSIWKSIITISAYRVPQDAEPSRSGPGANELADELAP